jgi:hypothetical protein
MDCDIVFLITTFDRADSCRRLVKKLAPIGDIYILNDGSEKEYNLEKSLLKGHEITIVKQSHGGKRYYWKTVNRLWKLPEKRYKYYFMIPDDFLPVHDFTDKALQTWKEITDPKKICLNTYVDQGRLNKDCWTGVKSVEYDNYRYTGWVDMCFMCERRFFDVVGIIPQINLNWNVNPQSSSGMGAHISKLLNRKGFKMYQTKTSLFIPQKEAFDSKMNSWRKDDKINIAVL